MVSRTQVVKYIRKGEKGDKGDKGEQGAVMRGPQAWSDCENGYIFYSGGKGEQWKDVVLYNGNYYSCVKSHAKTDINYPGSTSDNNNDYWQLGDKIELVAANLLLANYALIKNLGAEAIEMKNSAGETVFLAKDGKLQCNLGTFNNIDVQSGTFNNIDVQSGKIAGFHIQGDGLTNKGFNNDAYIIFRNDNRGAFAGIGGNVLPLSSGVRSVARFENREVVYPNSVTPNYAMVVSAQGAKDNCAMYIDGGYIAGLALKNKVISVTTTLDRFDQHIVTINTSEITITLPTMQSYDDGHIIRLKCLGGGPIKLALGDCYFFDGTILLYGRPILVYDNGKKLTGTNTLTLSGTGNGMDLIWVRDIVSTINGSTYHGAWLQYKLSRDW